MEHLLSSFVLARKLYELGFLAAKSLPCALQQPALAVAYALRSYQEFHGLATDAWCGPVTRDSLMAPRFCGLPDRMDLQADTALCKWPQSRITYAITGQLPGVSPADLQAAYALAWRQWADVCDLEPVYTLDLRSANVLMGSAAIDGALNTLAYSELPCMANPVQLKQTYDTSESWVIADGPTAGRQIDLVRVACHEIAHALGMPHIAAGNLLAPIYSPTIRKPQAGDIAEMVKRYGPVAAPPPVAPANPPPPPAVPPVGPPETEYVIVFPQPVSKITIRRAA